MGKTTKETSGKDAKAEGGAGPATAPVATGEEDYYDIPESATGLEVTGRDTQQPPADNLPSTSQGQSPSHGLGGVGDERNRNAPIEPNRGQGQYDTFILRHLHTFKGEYNGTAITDWVQKVDLLIRLTEASDDTILQLLSLRVDTQVINFLEGLRQRLEPTQYTWARVKQALLKQFGGIVDPHQTS